MCFKWSISLMALKFLSHDQLISLVKRQKDRQPGQKGGERELVR